MEVEALYDGRFVFGVQQIYLAKLHCMKFYRMTSIEIPILSSNKQVNYTQLARIDIFVSSKEIK